MTDHYTDLMDYITDLTDLTDYITDPRPLY